MPDGSITVTRIIESTGTEIEVTLSKVDESTAEVVSYKRRNKPGVGPFARRKVEEGQRWPLSRMGLGVSSWEELIAAQGQ